MISLFQRKSTFLLGMCSSMSIKEFSIILKIYYSQKDSFIARLVKNPPAMWQNWIGSLGWEDALEKGKAIHSSILA